MEKWIIASSVPLEGKGEAQVKGNREYEKRKCEKERRRMERDEWRKGRGKEERGKGKMKCVETRGD